MPERMPRYDDDELGVSYFRTALHGEYMAGLTLPRTYVARSEIARTSFQNTDLQESCLCWNDFVEVNFRETDLGGADLRASVFTGCVFNGARLDGADLRLSTFEKCRFDGASFKGAILARDQKAGLRLSVEQVAEIAWTDDPGDEPDGG